MKTLTILVCCAFVVQSSCNGISIIGSKYIRANRPYTVAVANSLNKAITLKLSLECEDSETEVKTYRLASLSGKTVQFSVPIITFTSDCIFSAINDGGEVTVNHNVILEIPDKTVSIFILTDKPVYKPGDELRFRVVVVDIETKPVTNINAIEVLIEDPYGNSVRHWPFARLNKGVFETSYQMAAEPVLGKWTITVTVDDSSISNKKIQSFEVMEYVLPKFAVKAWPTKTLLIGERKISLIIDSHYTFGERVEGKVRVNLYLNKYTKRASYEAVQHINGSTVVEFRLRNELEVEEEEDYTLVNMTVAVTDSITNATVSIEQIIPVYLKPHKISLVKPSLYYRPGAPYHFKVSVKDHTGVPVEKGKMIKIFFGDEETQAPLDDQGLASFVISTPHEVDSIAISAEFESVKYEDIGFIEGLESSNTQFLQIQPRDRFKVSKKSSFAISSNEPIEQFSYFVVTRGSIVDFGHIKSGKRKTQTLSLKLTEAMAPKATLVVFFDKDGQFIADYCDLNFESFGNDFEFKLDKMDEEAYRPNEEIFVEGKAQEDSIIFFQAIDQSALLLGHTAYGLSKQGILDDLDQYNGKEWIKALGLFDSIGIFYSNGSDVNAIDSNRAKRSSYLEQRRVQKAVLLRLDFPESWLWRNSSMNRRNSFEIQDFVPDSITSWYVTAFALSPTRGLGIMEYPRKFTVGKPFYMIAHLPYSIKRGEVALIQVTLYNFLGNTVTTDVTLFNKNDEIEFIERSYNDDSRRIKAVMIASHQVKMVSFLIKAKKLGEIAIKIEAVNALTSDGLEHMLRVTPESRRYKRNDARFIDLRSIRNQTFEISCDIPRDSDPGSIKIEAVIDHDLIGIPAKYSESLINIPNGSGDLNLLTLIPNIVALDYLSSTKLKVDETVKQRAIDSLKKGYRNQLKYRSPNGAFGQWKTGKESIFLTALVVNTLVTASRYITVDRAVIRNAFSWLESKQKPDGSFDEIGEVVYTPMQDSSSSVALTAFVVAAIRENPDFPGDYKPLVVKAANWLARKIDGLSSDYDRILATYALSLTMHKKRAECHKILVDYALKNREKRNRNDGSLSVEIEGYALLSFIAQNVTTQGLAIYKWLNQRRLSSGEFEGVQSTFVGLKALGKMAQILSQSRADYNVQIRSKSQPRTWRFDIDRSRALSTTKQELSDTDNVFQVDVSGTGYGFFQLSYQYHKNTRAAKNGFNLTVELVQNKNQRVQNLGVCLKYIPHGYNRRSNMALVEVHFPSGFIVNDNAVQDLSPDKEIKNTIRSFDGSTMYVYYNSVGPNQVCFEVTARRKFKIAMHRPAYVLVYDTEDRDQYALVPYDGIVLQPCDICEDEDCRALKC